MAASGPQTVVCPWYKIISQSVTNSIFITQVTHGITNMNKHINVSINEYSNIEMNELIHK